MSQDRNQSRDFSIIHYANDSYKNTAPEYLLEMEIKRKQEQGCRILGWVRLFIFIQSKTDFLYGSLKKCVIP